MADAAVPGIDTSLIVSTRPLTRWFKLPDETAAEAEFELERTEAGFFFEHRDGRPVLEERNHRLTAPQTPVMTIADDGTGDVPTIEIEPVTRAQDIANVVRVPVHTYSTGASKVLWTAGGAIEVPESATLKLVVHYPNRSSTAGDVGVSSWEAVTSNTDYTPQTDLTVTSEAEGDNLVITLVNGSTAAITLPSLQARGSPWIESDRLEIEEIDQPSIDEFEPRPYAIPSRWITSISEARDYALFLLNLHKQPRRRLIISWFGADDPARALGTDLSDRVTVFERDSAVTYFLEAIRHELTAGLKHLVTYTLSPVLPFWYDVYFRYLGVRYRNIWFLEVAGSRTDEG